MRFEKLTPQGWVPPTLLVESTSSRLVKRQKRNRMLYTIAVVLLVLWALGLLTSNVMGGFIHILLVAAVVVVLVRLIQGRSVPS